MWSDGRIDIGLSDGSSFDVTNWGYFCGGTGEHLSTGDFDGNGQTDFLCKTNYQVDSVALSRGNRLSANVWAPGGFCRVDQGQVIAGDFNSDGKTDLACHTTAANVEMWLSDGDSFNFSGIWMSNWCRYNGGTSWGVNWGVSQKVFMPGDFDGDGNTDLMCRGLYGLPAGPWIAFSNGTSAFTHGGKWTGVACGGNDQRGLGDFNGDGKTDIYCYDNKAQDATWKAYVGLSTGSDFSTGEWAVPLGCSRLSIGDVNGDARTDLWCHSTDNQRVFVGLSNGISGFTYPTQWHTNFCGTNNVVAGDFNGDSKTDISCLTNTGSTVSLSGSVVGKTDLLTDIQSSLGGTTTVAYVPGTQWSTTVATPPTVVSQDKNGVFTSSSSTHPRNPGGPTVSSVTLSDGLTWSSTTTYSYEGGLYNAAERRWLGFRYSKTTLPALANESAGPYIESEYSQDIAAPGTLEAQLRRDGNGNALSGLVNALIFTGDGESEPYTARISARTTYTYDGSGTECTAWPCTTGERTYQEYDYDTYGNRVTTRSYGNYDATGDESTSVAEYFPNTSEYVVNKAARTVSYLGIGTAGAKLSESLFYFDGATQYTEAPLAGLLTNQGVWRDTDDSYVFQCALSECFEYDTYGNLTKVVNTKGGKTTIAYDTAYALFPESTKNALGHTFSSSWDPVCEGPLSTTDANGQITTTTYDALCRHARTDGPLGGFVQTTYPSFGEPNAQHTQVETAAASGAGTQWSRHYFDGLGRRYLSERRGPSAGEEILSDEVTYNARGGVATAARPRFTGDTAYTSSFEYDARNRQTEATLPDAATLTVSYGLRSVTTTNPEGHITVTERNDTALTSYLDEYLGESPITTTTTTDPGARTRTVTDHVGNVLVTYFNSLGQITSINAPDSGIETREYNDAGEMVATVNALTERTELAYDLIGRLTSKTTRAGTPNAETTSFTYDEPTSGYFNVGLQTSMTDAAGTALQDYNALGQVVRAQRSIDAVNYTSSMTYNAAGVPTSVTYPDAQVISYTYDATGNLLTETGTISDSQYNASGQLISRTYANGVVTTNTYSDQRGWLDRIYTTRDTVVHQDLNYTYLPDGMISSVTSVHAMEGWTYAYDQLNRLTGATNADTSTLDQSFTYDAIGNITYNSNG